jgi:hypothetical protein
MLAATVALPAVAADHREQVRFTPSFPDLVNELAVFINTDRATYCTTEVVAFEEDLVDWINGGFQGPPPAEPAFPEGFDTITVQQKETGKGAIVALAKGSGLVIELWELDAEADRPFVGPCLDTDDKLNRVARGTTTFRGNDNDLEGSGTRGNAFGDQGNANVSANGDRYRYSWKFHLNDRCYAPEDGPPACLIDRAKLQKRN